MAAPGPHTPQFSDFPFGNSPETGQPALTQKCSQLRPHFPRFSPVSGSKQPQTSLLGTDADPCTRVKHQNRPQRRLRRVPARPDTAPGWPRTAPEDRLLPSGCDVAKMIRFSTSLLGTLAGTRPFTEPVAPTGSTVPELLAPMQHQCGRLTFIADTAGAPGQRSWPDFRRRSLDVQASDGR